MIVPFNKPLVVGTEKELVSEVMESRQFSANGPFTHKSHKFLEESLDHNKALLTTSCTAALELIALLLEIQPGDEIIIPSYAFITTANAFASRGAKILFADSRQDHPSIDESQLEELITERTKAIVALHYGGVACNMDAISEIAQKYSVHIIEDNAQGVGGYYNEKPLGSLGTLGALSFHESKNIHCGEGGAMLVNDETLFDRAEAVWDMGTNRKEFRAGKSTSYGWVDVGGSFYPSELNAAFLYAQMLQLGNVTNNRLDLWNKYYQSLETLETEGVAQRPHLPEYAGHNGHIFYLLTASKTERDNLIHFLMETEIEACFHFQSLHRSKFFKTKYEGPELKNVDRFADTLVRLPLFSGIEPKQDHVIDQVIKFYKQ